MSSTSESIEVFVAYAREDKDLLKELKKWLKPWDNLVAVWYDGEITPGQDWAQEIYSHLYAAPIVLLLISIDFLSSPRCKDEMKHAMMRHRAGEACVIPIIIRPCPWEDMPISILEVLPTGGQPISEWPSEEKAFLDVTQRFHKMVEGFLIHKRPATSISPDPVLPVRNLPYPVNRYFTGRKAILNRLHKELINSNKQPFIQPKAISGIGGLGKTELVVEYAYRFQAEYQIVLWLRADTKENLISDLMAIAQLVNVHQENLQDQDTVVAAVKKWFKEKSDWLLIIDDVNDSTYRMVRDMVPGEGKGHVLITTLIRDLSPLAQRIELDTMTVEEGATFLLRRANKITGAAKEDHATAENISKELHGLPLALDQAGAYIIETNCSLSEFIDWYRIKRASILKTRGNHKHSDDHPASVAATFLLSFEKVKRNPVAAELLQCCSLLSSAPNGILEKIIVDGAPELGEVLSSNVNGQRKLAGVIKELHKYSLLKRDPTTKTLTMHRLVQNVLVDEMDEDALRLWAHRTIQAINRAFPEVAKAISLANHYHRLGKYALAEPQYDYVHSFYKQHLAPDHPHLITSWRKLAKLYYDEGKYLAAENSYQEAQKLCQEIWGREIGGKEHYIMALCLNDLADVALAKGDYVEAESFCAKAIEIAEKTLVRYDPIIAACLNTRAKLYYVQGNYPSSEPRYLHALAIWERRRESDYSDIITCLINLSELYRTWGKYSEAESLCQRIEEISQKIEPEHPDVAACLDELARFAYIRGRFSDAEKLYGRAQKIREKVLDSEHPDLALTYNNLGVLYHAQAKYTQAEQIYTKALNIQRQSLGLKHPNVATTLGNLGRLYEDQGNYTQAEALYLQSQQILEEIFDRNHPNVAVSLNNQAGTYLRKQDYEKAEKLYREALDICIGAFGIGHIEKARCLANLANLCRLQDKHAEAERHYVDALDIFERELKPEHPYVATLLSNLAELYHAQGEYRQVEKLLRRALGIYEKAHGLEHPDVADCLDNLATLYRTWARYEEAKKHYDYAREIRAKVPGLDHPKLAVSLNNLAKLAIMQGKFTEAQIFCTQSLQICDRVLSKENLLSVACYTTQGELYHLQSNYSDAEKHYMQAYEIRCKFLGKNHSDIAVSLNNLGRLYDDLEKYDDAKKSYQQAQAIFAFVLDREHPTIAITLNNLATVCMRESNFGEAKRLFNQALNICEKVFGESHPDTASCYANLAWFYREQGDYKRALRLYEKTLKISQRALGPSHPQVAYRLNNLGELYFMMGKYTPANEHFERAASMLEQSLGTNHPKVIRIRENFVTTQQKLVANVHT